MREEVTRKNRSKWGNWRLLSMLLVAVLVLAACGGDSGNEADKQATDKPATDKPAADQDATDKPATTAKFKSMEELPDQIADFKGEEIDKAEFEKFLRLMRFFNPNYKQEEMKPEYFNNQLSAFVMYKNSTSKVAKKTPANDPLIEQIVSQTESGMNKQLGENTFANRLKEFNLSKQDVVNYFRSYNDNVEYLKSRISEKEYQDVYNSQLKAGQLDKYKATVSHILIMSVEGEQGSRTKEEALKKAKEVLAELRAGADFAALAKKYSEDPGSKDNGGIYADTDVDQWVPAFRQAAIDLPLNQLSEPVETNYGYHIMKVLKREKTGVKSFEEVKSTFEKSLWEKKFQTVFTTEVEPEITNNRLK